MPEIIVRGRAEAHLDPTEAHIAVTVHVRSADGQADAVERCARRAAAVDEAIAGMPDGLVRREATSSVRTGPEYDRSSTGRRLVAWTASRTSELVCAPDADGLTALVDLVARMDDVRLSGPRWVVAPDAVGWAEVRMGAAADARRRAESYTAGLDARVGLVVRIAEPGLSGGGHDAAPVAFATRAMSRAGGGDEEEVVAVRIVPEPVEVTVEVDVTFDLA